MTRWKRLIDSKDWTPFFSALAKELGDLPFVRIKQAAMKSGFQAAWQRGEQKYWLATSGTCVRILFASIKNEDEIPPEIREWATVRGADQWLASPVFTAKRRNVDLHLLDKTGGWKERTLIQFEKKAKLRSLALDFHGARELAGSAGLPAWIKDWAIEVSGRKPKSVWIAREKNTVVGVVALVNRQVVPLWGDHETLSILVIEGLKRARLWGHRHLEVPEGLV